MMKRRNFNLIMSLGPLALGLHNRSESETTSELEGIRPDYINSGDVIGLIAPASAISEDRIQRAHENIRNLGYLPKEGKYIRARYGYLAGTDTERVEDIHNMYKDPDVKAIWCIRGGYGCTRIIDMLDYRLIRKNPKPLIGYSDITALHHAIFRETGIYGLHGPVASSNTNVYNEGVLKNFLSKGSSEIIIEKFDAEAEMYDPYEVFSEGIAEGRISGGNLSLLVSMIGTKYAPKYKNTIVFIEDVGEEPYRIDRMLTQLITGSDFSKAKAIILGQFSNCNPKNPEMSLSLKECLKDRLMPLGIPVVYGLNFGHVDHNFTFPIGARALINSADPNLIISYL